jgi:hypothetical protein
VAGGVAAAALLVPPAAAAHVGGIEYKFPLPVWLYALAGGIAVLASAPAAALAVRGTRSTRTVELYRSSFARIPLGRAATVLASLVFADVVVGGVLGDQLSFTANPAPIVIWVVFWVGLGVTSALVGNVFDFVSPLSAAARAVDRALARRGARARAYPELLGVWPSVLLLIGWAWLELVWADGFRGRYLIAVVVGYCVLQLVGAAIFGAEVWLGRAELFTVFARTYARFAPTELYVRAPERECRAGRCRVTSERVGCPSCWLDAPPEARGIRLRPYGSGVRREPSLGEGGGAFVVAALGTVVYDGFRGTVWYRGLVDSFGLVGRNELAGTLAMAVVLAAFLIAFLVVCATVGALEGTNPDAAARRYAPTLIPIAAVYFVAHYFLYFFIVVQIAPGTLADPFEREWFPDYSAWRAIPPAVVWWLQAGVIVWGHVVSVLEAHRVSLAAHRRARRAFVAQLPLVLLMVGYTFAGLWILGQALRGE